MATPTKANLDNKSNQKNPNHDAYYQSRGEEKRPKDWQTRLKQGTK